MTTDPTFIVCENFEAVLPVGLDDYNYSGFTRSTRPRIHQSYVGKVDSGWLAHSNAFNPNGGPYGTVWSVYFRIDEYPTSSQPLFYNSSIAASMAGDPANVNSPPYDVGLSWNNSTGCIRPFVYHTFQSDIFNLTPTIMQATIAYGSDGLSPELGQTYLLDMWTYKPTEEHIGDPDVTAEVRWNIDEIFQSHATFTFPGYSNTIDHRFSTTTQVPLNMSGGLVVIGNAGTVDDLVGPSKANITPHYPASTGKIVVDDWVVVLDESGTWITYPIGGHTDSCDNRGSFFALPGVQEVSFDQLLTGEGDLFGEEPEDDD